MTGKLKLFVSDSYISPVTFDDLATTMTGFSVDTLDILCHPEEFCSPREQLAWVRRLIKDVNEGSDTLYVFTNSDFITREINLQMLSHIRMRAGCELVNSEFAIDPNIVSSYTIHVIHDSIHCIPNEKDDYGCYVYDIFDDVIHDIALRLKYLIWGESYE